MNLDDAIAAEYRALPGTITMTIDGHMPDMFMRNCTVVRVEHDVSPAARPRTIIYASYMALSRAMCDDAGIDINVIVMHGVDRWIRPWLYRDWYAWPYFDLFPRVTRAWRWTRRKVHL